MKEIQGLKLKPRDVAGYVLLPGIVPRVKALFGTGFGWIAHLMALIYYAARLLPSGHPYLNSDNIGRFSIRHVIAEAASNLLIKKENIDQIVIFVALLVGFVLLFVQFAFLIFSFLSVVVFEPAFAQAAGPEVSVFATTYKETDLAFMMMDLVFAIPNMFGSEYDPGSVAGIPPFNAALHDLFQFYSLALLVVGVVIFLYYIVVVIAETATTGVPFGKRFASVWAPIRLVVALGLLVPIHLGLNSGQYIALYSARLGSSFATNAWIEFNNNLIKQTSGEVGNPLGARYHEDPALGGNALIARPDTPDVQNLVKFMTLVNTCRGLYLRKENGEIQIKPYLVKNPLESVELDSNWLIGSSTTNKSSPIMDGLRYWFNNGDIIIRFGEDGKTNGAHKYPLEKGGVKPLCGEIRLRNLAVGAGGGVVGLDDLAWGVEIMQERYWDLILALWFAGGPVHSYALHATQLDLDQRLDPISRKVKLDAISTWQTYVDLAVDEAYLLSTNFALVMQADPASEVLKRGWAGAGLWYNYIAQWNGALIDAVRSAPEVTKMPYVLEQVFEQRSKSVENMDAKTMCSVTGKGAPLNLNDSEKRVATILCSLYNDWLKKNPMESSDEKQTSNVFMDYVAQLFGVDGLFDMRAQDSVHPLAQLTNVGKNIVDNSVYTLMASTAASFGGGMFGAISGTQGIGAAASAFSGMFVSLTSIGLSVGFLLYYILPFLPFMYFFFALGSWVKTVFEAMVGVPLWALAHLRIDGTGLSGEAASNGYFLIFEIFIRPILTLFGLLSGLIIFTALVRTMNGIFDLVTANMGGFDGDTTATIIGDLKYKRGVIDEFFFTIMYAVLVYMMATASFKMIDAVPNGILRWMGAGVQSFADSRDDPAGNLVQWAAFGGASMARQFTGAINQGSRLAGEGVGTAIDKLKGSDSLTKRIGGSRGQGMGK